MKPSLDPGKATHSTTAIQKSGGKVFSPSGLPRSHFPLVQCVFGFQTWKNGRYGFSIKLSNGSAGVSSAVCALSFSRRSEDATLVGCAWPEGMICSFS